ncbi:glycoside hydrolase family 10 protein [Lophiostoma macrostomum CBS 122681]|uniref:Beta-xylanase n=1 Tax=Lophiostoma macrostomum CBS 122681 TaxID=1314788 RepID=A0A6A6TCP1_9PLEO|nr:glycoside hydrolase family 10 protein [Lophiostoma macrostomum CBS 122681]
MKLSHLTLTLATTPLLSASPTPAYPHPSRSKYPGLDILAKRAGLLYFGTAIDNVVLNNTQYTSIAHNASEFGQVTPSNGQKWMYIEPARNVFNYSMGDAIVLPAIAHRQLRRCHNFVWHNQLPDWLTTGNWTKSELEGILENHIRHEAQHYYGECYAWDVVNEAFNDNGTLRSDIWLDTIGPEYIALAFRFARKYTRPGTKLYYNDYGIERINNKSLAVAAMVEDFLSREEPVPIDGVGLQAHFTAGTSPGYENITRVIEVFAEKGVETALTELDVRVKLPDSSEEMVQQAKDYADSVRACVDSESCVGVTVWDFWDTVSWVPDTFPGFGDACLWTANFTKKPAYYAISDVLRGD